MGTGERMPELSTDVTDGNAMKYWVLFVYPESMQTDVIEALMKGTFAEQLDDMFGTHAPPLNGTVADIMLDRESSYITRLMP